MFLVLVDANTKWLDVLPCGLTGDHGGYSSSRIVSRTQVVQMPVEVLANYWESKQGRPCWQNLLQMNANQRSSTSAYHH